MVDKLLVPSKNEIKLFFRDESIKINSSLNVYLSAKLKMRILSKAPVAPLIRKGSYQEEQKSFGNLDFENMGDAMLTEPATGNNDREDYATHL